MEERNNKVEAVDIKCVTEYKTRVKIEPELALAEEVEAPLSIDQNYNDVVGGAGTSKSCKRKSSAEVSGDHRNKRIMLSLVRPSATLRYGADNVRVQARDRLCCLLNKYVRQQNWVEACGILSVLLKGTCKDRSSTLNRFKYSAAMEFLQQTEGDHLKSYKIKRIYDTWMKKLGLMKKQPVQERFAVHLEFILFCLTEGSLEEAHQAALRSHKFGEPLSLVISFVSVKGKNLMQENDYGEDPMSNLMIGLTFCQLWYSTIPNKFQLKKVDHPCSHEQSDMSESRFNNVAGNLGEHDLSSHTQVADSLHQCESESSVMIDKRVEPQSTLPPYSIFTAHGLESWLLPIRLPHVNESDEFFFMYPQMFNDYYRSAVKYLQLALNSTPPESAALLPLVQLLLVKDNIDDALAAVENFCSISKAAFSFRVKASLLDCFKHSNHAKVSSSFEDVLRKDPTCSYSMAKLVSMHQKGDYDDESLLEMIALHLDATFAEHCIWKEFALCFLGVSFCEEDRLSVNENGNENEDRSIQWKSVGYRNIPNIFIKGSSGRNWKLRYRWWKRRHFNSKILNSEILAGDFELMTYKAACASHIYGQEFNYVEKTRSILDDNTKRELEPFLEKHMKSSIGLHTKFEN